MLMCTFKAVTPDGRYLCCMQLEGGEARAYEEKKTDRGAYTVVKRFAYRQRRQLHRYARWELPRVVLSYGEPVECLPVGFCYTWDVDGPEVVSDPVMEWGKASP